MRKIKNYYKLPRSHYTKGLMSLKLEIELEMLDMHLMASEKHNYGVVRELVGHGIGKVMHEKPEMPITKRGYGKRFKEGMVVAIEPMINMKTHKIIQHADGWTITTKDNHPSAHFEHNVAIINGKPEMLSTFKFIYKVLGIKSDEEKIFIIFLDKCNH